MRLLWLLLVGSLVVTGVVSCPSQCHCLTSPGLPSFASLPALPSGLLARCNSLGSVHFPQTIDSDLLYVEFQNNSIEELEVFDEQNHILNLLLLDASFNNLTGVGRFDADFITHLNLNHNHLTQIPRTSRSVLTLSLAYNQIEIDPEDNILFYLQLIRLQLSYNRLKKLFPKFPSSLKYLYLAGNEISTIDIDSLRNLEQLQVINLENNNLLQLGLNEAQAMSKIKNIELGLRGKLSRKKDLIDWCKQKRRNETTYKLC